MAISIIVAHDKNNGIGLKGKIPWYIPDDFKWFKRHTIGKSVVMGTTTYFSLPDKFRPLPDRGNFVLCGECEYHDKIKKEGAKVFVNYLQVLELAKDNDIFIIGGASLYKLFIDYADYLYITRINKKFECDTFFPELNNEWDHVYKGDNIEFEDFTYSFNFYAKKKEIINV